MGIGTGMRRASRRQRPDLEVANLFVYAGVWLIRD
jgi:hypothetical protein